MAFPVICYKNILRTTPPADPGTASGYNLADIYDLKGHTVWKSSVTTSPIDFIIDTSTGQNANYVALINHNLNDGNYRVEVFADTFTPPTTSRLTAFQPLESTVTLRTFTAPGSLRYWKIRLTDLAPPFGVAPFIGELMLGMKTDIPEYLSPDIDPFATDYEVRGSRSDGGHFLGATIRGQMHRDTIRFGPAGIARAWFTSDGNDFIASHANKRQPFIFVVDTADTDFDTPYYVRVPDNSKVERHAVGGSYQRFTLDIPFEEAFMEPAP